MIEKNEMDGGTTFADGRRMQIVLDENGVFKRTEEMGKGKPKTTSMDAATDRAVASGERPLASMPPPVFPTTPTAPDNQPPTTPGTGFKAPM